MKLMNYYTLLNSDKQANTARYTTRAFEIADLNHNVQSAKLESHTNRSQRKSNKKSRLSGRICLAR